MARPKKPRRVCFVPGVTYFKPRGIPMRVLEEVRLSVDELEALRLKDLMDLEQDEAAREMGVSRQTFQRVLDDAHRKVAEALVAGKALEIEGGDYEVVPMDFRCRRCGRSWQQLLTGGVPVVCPNCEERHEAFPAYPVARQQRECPMPLQPSWPQSHNTPTPGWDKEERTKLAVISDDGSSISMHFGRARYYVVYSVENGQIVSREVRTKVGHHTSGDHPHQDASGTPHGYDAASQDKHSQMARNIQDCRALLAGGMGWGAHDSLRSYGIEPIITDIRDIEQAVRAYLDGTIRNLSERLH